LASDVQVLSPARRRFLSAPTWPDLLLAAVALAVPPCAEVRAVGAAVDAATEGAIHPRARRADALAVAVSPLAGVAAGGDPAVAARHRLTGLAAGGKVGRGEIPSGEIGRRQVRRAQVKRSEITNREVGRR